MMNCDQEEETVLAQDIENLLSAGIIAAWEFALSEADQAVEYVKMGACPNCNGNHVTGLYTLRAWLRGKLHRHNPPEEIRDFNRTVQEQGLPYKLREWDATDHNRKIAEKVAEGFRRKPEPATATG